MRYVTPNDQSVVGSTDVERIQNAIQLAKQTGVNAVLIPRLTNDGRDKWVIDQAILLPSDIVIYLDNCVLWTPQTAMCNIFRSENFYDESTRNMEGEQHGIQIIGLGNATLDGGEYNGLSESNGGKDGRPSIWNNSMILMNNVRDVKIKNLRVLKNRWWAFCFGFCREVDIDSIYFYSDYTYVNDKGERCFDRTAMKEYECYVKNADGIDLRNGCNNFRISNITGRTEDDTVALTTLQGSWAKMFVEGKDNDIHDVIIKDLRTDCLACGNIRLCCADGNKVYNVTMDGIYDEAPDGCGYYSGGTIKINDSYYRYTRISQLGDMFNLSISNVYSKSECAVRFEQTANNVSINNVYQSNPNGYAVAHFAGYGYLRENNGPFDYDNISINNVFYTVKPNVEYGVKFENCNATNVTVGNVGSEVKCFVEKK